MHQSRQHIPGQAFVVGLTAVSFNSALLMEPSEFLISKDRASPGAPWITPFFYLYTVFVGDENFAVTEPTDERFYDYLYKRVIAEDDNVPVEQPPRRPNLITRFFRWMEQPI